jgi:phosphonate transport system substrate-binding protein
MIPPYKKIIVGLAIVTAVLVWLGGCDSNNPLVVDFDKPAADGGKPLSSENRPTLRVAVGAMVSPKETYDIYRQLFLHIGKKTNRELDLIQRKTYSEINMMLMKGQLDLAFLCSGPYVMASNRGNLELLAVPRVQGATVYKSYLIVNEKSRFETLSDLKGRSFAFTDPASNTGRMAPTYWLALMGERPETFFSQVVFTYSHDNSILAVARGLVDGATVDSLIWDYFNERDPVFTSQTKIIRESEPYGIPPLVVPMDLDPELKAGLRDTLYSMHDDVEGKKILESLMIDRFVPAQDDWYDSVREMIAHIDINMSLGNEIEQP